MFRVASCATAIRHAGDDPHHDHGIGDRKAEHPSDFDRARSETVHGGARSTSCATRRRCEPRGLLLPCRVSVIPDRLRNVGRSTPQIADNGHCALVRRLHVDAET
jgi:hypothetical protein